MRINSYASTEQAIQAPFTYYYVNNNDWSSSHSYQFWNKNFINAVDVNNDVTLKTIYSPSPSGFVEPKTAAFTGVTSTGGNTSNGNQFNVSGSFNKGYYFYTIEWKMGNTIFFDALGYRDTYKGAIGAVTGVGSECNCWSVGALSTSNARDLGFNLGSVHPQNTDLRSYGFSVRSVAE